MAETRDRLAAEDRDLGERAARLSARIEELAAQHAEALQRKAAAVRDDDEPALREAAAALIAAGELGQARQAELSQVQARLGHLRGEEGEIAAVAGRLGRARLRLVDLRRAEAGLPPVLEQQTVVAAILGPLTVVASQGDPDVVIAALLGLVPDEAARDAMRGEFARLGELDDGGVARGIAAGTAAAAAWAPVLARLVDTLAVRAPDRYEALRSAYVRGSAAPEPEPLAPAEVLSSAPGLVKLGDGTLRYEPSPRWGR